MPRVIIQRWPDSKYLKSYDPNWQPDPLPEGDEPWHCGLSDWTTNPAEAKVFNSVTEAMDCWNQTASEHPVRGDGRPNKPLTAYSIEVVPAPPPKGDADGSTPPASADQG